MRFGRVAVAGAAVCLVASAGSAQPATAASSVRECTVVELSRAPLILDDSLEVYVPPQVFASGTGEILLLGVPNFAFRRQPTGPARLVSEARLLGVLLDSALDARPVPAPLDPLRIASVTAVHEGHGRWYVLLEEYGIPADPRTRRSPSDSIVRLWGGVFDGTHWLAFDSIALPSEVRLRGLTASLPVAHEGRVTWLMRGSQRFLPVLLDLERSESGWTSTIIDTRAGIYSTAEYSDGDRFIAAVGPGNALYLWSRESGSYAEPVLDRSAFGEDVHSPHLVRWNDRLVLTWMVDSSTGRAAWATMNADRDLSLRDAFVVDPTMARMGRAFSLPGIDQFVWVTEHGSDSATGIQITRISPNGARSAARFLTPFAAGLGVRLTGEDTLLLTGAETDEAAALARSLFVSVQMKCD